MRVVLNPYPLLCVLLLLGTVAACGGAGADEKVADLKAPRVAACRNLQPTALDRPSNSSPVVDCTEPHDAETFAVGRLPKQFTDAERDDPALDTWAYGTCTQGFQEFLGGDESLVMRTVLSWVWFRPSQQAWDAGARWYRCDVVGGATGAERLLDLPTTTKGLLASKVDQRWLVCATGSQLGKGERVPCSQEHQWRAVTTIKLGAANAAYPGDSAVEDKTKAFCSDSVRAWLGYPEDFEYAYTWFGSREWTAGNRRSVCWARTAR